MYYWNYKTSYEDGFINTSKPVTMKFKIPEGWNKNNIQLAYWGGPDTGGIDPASKYSVEIVGVEGDYYVVKTQRIGYFALI